jgi:acyl-CoA synthetase (NDP forming)
MGKDKIPKNKTPRHEAKQNDSSVELIDEGAASPQIHTRGEFQEAFDELKASCEQWAITQSELWEQRMVEHRDSIVKSINQAIEEKIQPKINHNHTKT